THKVDTIVFDKTGTITEGKPVVTDIVTTDLITEEELLRLAASAEKGSEHPLGEAIVRGAEDKALVLQETTDFNALPGRGIEVKINDQQLFLGNKKLMDEKNISLVGLSEASDRLAEQGKTPMYISIDGKLAGIIAVADTIKDSSIAAIGKLH